MKSTHIIQFLEQSIEGALSVEEQIKFLKNVEIEAPESLAEVVQFLMSRATYTLELPGAIDFCGTGGSELPRINTSTPAAFLLAAAGVKVAKHGNRASSGRFGSFDLLEALGVGFEMGPAQERALFDSTGLLFLFAQKYHPVMRHFATARKQIGAPTFFNILGPLLNPANPKKQFIGTAFPDKARLIAETCKILGKEHVFVVHGSDGLDKATLTGPTRVLELKNGQIREYDIRPEDFSIATVSFDDISGSPSNNPDYIRNFIDGELIGPRFDLICLNAAFGLLLAEKAETLQEGFALAKQTVRSGDLKRFFHHYISLGKIPSILRKIVHAKKEELVKRKMNHPIEVLRKNLSPSERDFKAALQKSGKSLIAEIKYASPSEGEILGSQISMEHRARIYENEGASAISVLTDEKFFHGSLQNLSLVRDATRYTPLLCKDFIIDEYQIFEARRFGADAILLIAALLSPEEMQNFMNIARSLNMHSLCEVHNDEELKKVLQTDAEIVGINNRNLNDFSIDLKTSTTLCVNIPADKILISESGLYTRNDIDALPERIDGVLIGTAIMKSKAVPQTIHELIGRKPMLKICGVQSEAELAYCDEHHVNFVGFNFVPSSKRFLDQAEHLGLLNKPSHCLRVGVFKDQELSEVNSIADRFDLDYIQLSGEEDLDFIRSCHKPVIKSIRVCSADDLKRAKGYIPHVAYILLDGKNPGSGVAFDHELLKDFGYPFILAGGINLDNVSQVVSQVKPYIIDLASGVETNGVRSFEKIRTLKEKLTIHS